MVLALLKNPCSDLVGMHSHMVSEGGISELSTVFPKTKTTVYYYEKGDYCSFGTSFSPRRKRQVEISFESSSFINFGR